MLYKLENEQTFNCPQCGDALSIYVKYSKLVKCASCSSSVFLNDDSVKLIGVASVLSPEPSLIELHKPFSFKFNTFMPLGKIRYSYGRGFWEEWFLKDKTNKEFWLSIDEGDFVLQEKVKLPLAFNNPNVVKIGKKYGAYVATEIGKGECVGFDGELPQNIKLGETHGYIHLSADGGNLVTVEFVGDKMETFKGKWIDPLDIKVLR